MLSRALSPRQSFSSVLESPAKSSSIVKRRRARRREVNYTPPTSQPQHLSIITWVSDVLTPQTTDHYGHRTIIDTTTLIRNTAGEYIITTDLNSTHLLLYQLGFAVTRSFTNPPHTHEYSLKTYIHTNTFTYIYTITHTYILSYTHAYFSTRI